MPYMKTLKSFTTLIRLGHPIGWILAGMPGAWLLLGSEMPLSFWALWWAGAFFARSAGCILNDWCDQDIDRKVSRTRHRSFANGALGQKSFLLLLLFFGGMALSIAYTLGTEVFQQSLIIAPWIALYPTAKRWLSIPQQFLSPVFAYSIIIANTIVPNAQVGLWYMGTCAWILGYDTIYALSDIEDDTQLAVYSAPKTLKQYTQLFVALNYLFFIIIVILLRTPNTYLQYITSVGYITLLVSQVTSIHQATPQKLFKRNALVGSLIGLLTLLQANNL